MKDVWLEVSSCNKVLLSAIKFSLVMDDLHDCYIFTVSSPGTNLWLVCEAELLVPDMAMLGLDTAHSRGSFTNQESCSI